MRLALLLCLIPITASAQGRNCGPHSAVTAHLADNYGESRQVIGLASNNSVLEVYAADSGSWTILVTGPGGPACIVAAGQNYEHTKAPFPVPGEDG